MMVLILKVQFEAKQHSWKGLICVIIEALDKLDELMDSNLIISLSSSKVCHLFQHFAFLTRV
jgi:hypothetical protein